MPYATRKMLTSMNSSSATGSSQSSHKKSKRVREYPSSMDNLTSSSQHSSSTTTGTSGSSSRKSSGTSLSSGSSSSRKGSSTSVSSSSTHKSSGTSLSRSHSRPSYGSSSKKSLHSSHHSGSRASHHSKSSSHLSTKTSSASAVFSSSVKPVSMKGFNRERMNFDQRKAKFIQSQLKNNVERLQKLSATELPNDEFAQFTIDESKSVTQSHAPCNALVEVSHKDYPNGSLLAKLYTADSPGFDRKGSLYLKVLRHMGKKHPSIIHTLGVFVQDQTIYVIQDLATYGNMADYVGKNKSLDQTKAQLCARQLIRALDFMGDMGVCHRAISPHHLLFCHNLNMTVRLTGFRATIIYYDEKNNDINYQPCQPLNSKGPETEYQALEVFGDPNTEVFDPVTADVWSFGATIYFLITGQYPYQNRDNPQIEDEIQKNVRRLDVDSKAQNLLGHCLTTNSTERFSVEKLLNHPWIIIETVSGVSSGSGTITRTSTTNYRGSQASGAPSSGSAGTSGAGMSGSARPNSASRPLSGSKSSNAISGTRASGVGMSGSARPNSASRPLSGSKASNVVSAGSPVSGATKSGSVKATGTGMSGSKKTYAVSGSFKPSSAHKTSYGI